MKALIILSTLLNVLLIGGAAAFYFVRTDDAKHIANYVRMPAHEREIMQGAQSRVDELGPKANKDNAADEFKKLFVTDELRNRYKDARSPQEVQELLVAATRNTSALLTERQLEADSAQERLKIRGNEYTDFEAKITDKQRALERDKKHIDEEKKAWNDNLKNEKLNQIINDINKQKKVEEYIPYVTGREIDDIIFILSGVKDGTKRSMIFNGLTAEEKAQVKARDTNPTATLAPSIGGASSATPRSN